MQGHVASAAGLAAMLPNVLAGLHALRHCEVHFLLLLARLLSLRPALALTTGRDALLARLDVQVANP